MKNSILFICILPVLASCQSTKMKSVKLENSIDSLSYAMGINIGETIKKQGINDLNLDVMEAAIRAGIEGDSTAMLQGNEAMGYIQTYFQKKQMEEANKNIDAANEFMEENKKKANIQATPSGLQYEVITEGTGASPVDGDKVKVHYTGKLMDGTVFDSSVEKGEPATFAVQGVIPGFSEGLKMMKEGGKRILYIPPALGYGPGGAGPRIPGNSALIFEVELIQVNPEN